MTSAPLQTAARVLLLATLATTPLFLGRLMPWESAAALLAMSLAAALWVAGGGTLWPRRPTPADWLLAAALAGTALVAAWSVYLYDTLLHLSLLAGALLGFFLIRAALAGAPWNLRGWCALATGAALAGLWGAREYTTTAITANQAEWRAFGPFVNPNALGGYLALLYLVPVALALGAQTRARRAAPAPPAPTKRKAPQPAPVPPDAPPPRYAEIAGTLAALVIALGLLCTGSKGAILAAFAGALVFAVTGAQRGTPLGRLLRGGAVCMVGLALLAALTFTPIRLRIQAAFGSDQNSASFRVHTWRGALEMAQARPLTGFGPGAFRYAYPRFARAGYTRQAHETPLQLAAENGLPVALLWLAAIAATLWQVVRRGAGGELRERLLAAAAAGGVAGFWLHNLVDYTWYIATFGLAHWALLGLALPEVAGAEPPPTAKRRWPAAALLGALAVWSLVALNSEAALARGQKLLQMGATTVARASLERVLPLDARRWIELSRVAEADARGTDKAGLQAAADLRRRAISLQPTEPTNYVSLGRILHDLGDAAGAQAAIEKAIEVYPTCTTALAALGDLFDERGQTAQAAAVFGELVRLYDSPVRTSQAVEFMVDETYARGFAFLARQAAARDDRRAAEENAARALRVAAKFVQTQRAYRELLASTGRTDDQRVVAAERIVGDMADILKPSPWPVFRLRAGLALASLGRNEEAAEAFQPILVLGEGGPYDATELLRARALVGLAESLAALGREDEAKAAKRQGVAMGARVLASMHEYAAGLPAWDAEDTAEFVAAMKAAQPNPPH